ncbi:MAG: DUF1849 family protein [Bauldia sp.]|nr:DUF1849 family protein [Bauldia sp.]
MARSILAIAAAVAVGMAVTDASAEVPLVTGSAVYGLSIEGDGGGAMGGVEGSMTMTITLACDTYRSVTSLDADFDGPMGSLPLSIKSDVLENADSLVFDIRGAFALAEIERAKGTATRTDGGISVKLNEPAKETRSVEGDVVFPLAMISAAVEAAKAGETLIDFVTYDGSSNGRGVWLVSVTIGPAPEPGEDDSGEEALFAAGLGFADMQRWQMTFSYYPRDATGDVTPSFSSRAVVYENGFAQAASYDFGEFALQLTLDEFSPIPPEPCR